MNQTKRTSKEDMVDGVKEEMKRFGLSWEDAQFRRKCGRKIKATSG